MGAALREIIESVFKVRAEEAQRTLLAFAYLFCSIGAFIIGRIARTVLFLEIPDYKDQLPLMYVLIAITVSVTMYGYARVERKLRRDHTNAITLGVLTVVTLAFRFALHTGDHRFYWAFYIWVELFGSFVVVQFWTFANEIFHSRQAKRLFAVVGGGGVVANIVFGFGISGSVKALGTENLLYVICALMLMSLGLVMALGRAARTEITGAHERSPTSKQQASGRVFASRHVQLIAVVVVLTYLVSTLTDYQFQVIIGDSIPGKDDRSAYFGSFFGITGLLAGFVQFFITARLIERFGVLFALVLLPAGMLFGSAGLLAVPLISGLWAASATKGSENVLRYTVNDSTMQLLYLPVPTAVRGRVKAWIDGILKPVAIGGAGIALAVLVGQVEKLTGFSLGFKLDVYSLSWIVVGLLVAWIVALVRLRREYVATLVSTLSHRRLNFGDGKLEITDEATLKTLERALGGHELGEVLQALELSRFISGKAKGGLAPKVAGLLSHAAEEVRVAALDVLAEAGTQGETERERIAALLGDSSAKVRRAATLATCAVAREQALGAVTPLLHDPEPAVRGAAVAGLIRHGGLDGILACADLLKKMLSSGAPAEREQAAWVLGEVGVQTFCRPLLPLFDDASESVRLAAISAAGKLRSPELIASLLAQLGHPRLGSPAATALAGFGERIREAVKATLDDTRLAAAKRAHACRVLARLGDGRSLELLQTHLGDPEGAVRAAVIQAVLSIVRTSPSVRLDREAVRAAVRQEAMGVFALLAMHEDLALEDDTALLRDALAHRSTQAQGRIFGLLSLLYPAETVELVHRNLGSTQASTRANAVEVLDNLLDNETKAFIIPMFDEAPASKKLAQVSSLWPITRAGREERLTEILAGNDMWLRVAAAMAAATWKKKNLEPKVRALLSTADAVCRETAIVALRSLCSGRDLKKRLAGLEKDPAANVSRYAAYVLGELA